MGIIMWVIVGGLAGWIAEKLMKADHGLLTNIALGIAGAVALNFVLGLVGVAFAGLFGQFAVAVAGACALIYLYRMIRS